MEDVVPIKTEFPIFNHYPELVYLDSAATSQKPAVVIESISQYYQTANANVHRGVYPLSDEATQIWEDARARVARFVGAKSDELILTRNTTEALNGVAYGWGDHQLHQGDVIISSVMEHHSNLVPWQELAQRRGARLELVGVTADGELDLAQLETLLQTHAAQVKLVALSYVSNTLGTVNPLDQIVKLVRKLAPQARIVIDAAQAAPHLELKFDQLGIDFLAFSGHKILGPMGIGGLLVASKLLESQEFKPWLFGGGMIEAVFPQQAEFNPDPEQRFTAGTPDLASLVGLATACDYLEQLALEKVTQHDLDLLNYAWEELKKLEFIELLGPEPNNDPQHPRRLGSVAFTVKGVHAHDVAQVLANQQVAVRSGHHCCMPLHQALHIPASVRASFNVYNTPTDVDALIEALHQVAKTFLN